MTVTQYIGARYVPLFSDPIEWDVTKEYEPLTIVSYQGNSYTSKQAVPSNVEISNSKYWALTGNYNAQVESYRNEVKNYQGQVTDAVAKVETDLKEQTDKVAAQLETQNTNVATQLETQNTNVATQLETQNTNVATQLNDNKTYVDTEVGKVSNYRDAIVKCALLNSDLNRPIIVPAGTWFDSTTVPRTPETVQAKSQAEFTANITIYFKSKDLYSIVSGAPEDYIVYTPRLIDSRYVGVASNFTSQGASGATYISGSDVIRKSYNGNYSGTIYEGVSIYMMDHGRLSSTDYTSTWDDLNNVGTMKLKTTMYVLNETDTEFKCYPLVEGKIQLTYEDLFATYANLI